MILLILNRCRPKRLLVNDVQEELKKIAARINWFDAPERLLSDPDRFLAYFMQYCHDEDIATVRRYFTVEQFRHALENRPPGVMDEKSVAYWKLVLQE